MIQTHGRLQDICRCTWCAHWPPRWAAAPKCPSATRSTWVINLSDQGFVTKWNLFGALQLSAGALKTTLCTIKEQLRACQRVPLHSGAILAHCTEQGNRTEATQRLPGITRQVFNSIFLITDTEVFADRQQVCAWLWEGFYLAWNRHY